MSVLISAMGLHLSLDDVTSGTGVKHTYCILKLVVRVF